jgi:hypothetical protein
VQGRSPTCYSPVRHSSHSEERFPFDLHVLSTPPAFVLSQNQTLQTKTPHPQAGKNSNQNNLTPNHQKPNLAPKKHHPPNGNQRMAKNNNKQKPPNTLLSSQTTHPLGRATSPRQKPRTRSADDQEPTEVGLPSGSRRALRAGPVSQRRVNKLREGKLGVKWADRACLSARHLSCAPGCVSSDNRFNVGADEFVPSPGQPATARAVKLRQVSQRARCRQYSACHDAVPTSGRTGSLPAAAPTLRCRSARC